MTLATCLPQPLVACVLFVPFPMMGVGMALPFATIPVITAAPAPAAPTAPASNKAPASDKEKVTPPARVPGAGLPTALMALLRDENGPFLANQVFSATPAQPLAAIEEEVAAPEWYCITRGRFVGVGNQYALADAAITGVSHSARKAFTTQGLALDAFNAALVWGGVQVV
ncbi:hypothetical protein B0H13DRAFT_1928249 [Mycena leptocephala]|nr:hypothetical protein B0H13DRAFT_1928249 [Mycena leptocephala]